MTPNLTTLLRHNAALAWTCLAITMKADAAPDRILFDFQTATNYPAWQIVNDDVMGGVSTSRFHIPANGGAVFSGVVSLQNNGGFATVRSQPVRADLTGCDSFLLRVWGDGRRYKFSVRTEAGFDAPLYQLVFTTKRGEWEEQRLAFRDFVPTFRGRILTDVPPLNPAKVTSVGFLISDEQEGPFKLEVAWIKASARAGSLSGAVNAVSPEPFTNAGFTEALARTLRRPAFLPMPAFAVKLFLGEMGRVALLASARVRPVRLIESGFEFRFPQLDAVFKPALDPLQKKA
jgi:NADH dehydrogenase [ubiquinone] 1 alpha subcomplex assembly factor 1